MIGNLDDLKFEGGYPTVETIQKLYDQLDLQRAAQAYLDAAADLAEIESSLPDIQVTEQSFQAKQDAEAGLQRQVGAARQELHILTELKARKISLREEKEQLNAEIARLKVLERAFSKDGVPAMLIEQALPELERRSQPHSQPAFQLQHERDL